MFPKDATGERSSTAVGKAVFADSLKGVSDADAAAVEKERNWRFGYAKHVVKNVNVSLGSKEVAVKVATQGLAAAMDRMEFVRDGKTSSFAEAMKNIKGSFHTGIIKGGKAKPTKHTLEVPYKGTVLTGDALAAQLKK